jgi:hypothetical protein
MRAMRRAALPLSMVLAAALAPAQAKAPPAVPEALAVPAGERVVLRARATGAQIYRCTAASEGKPQWTLKAPDAELRDSAGRLIGHHGAGPSWQHIDGSAVTAKAAARADAPHADSIPWLLLQAVSHEGNGILAAVTHVQRIHTHGGQPPAASKCDSAKLNAEERVPYSADYYFYAPASH